MKENRDCTELDNPLCGHMAELLKTVGTGDGLLLELGRRAGISAEQAAAAGLAYAAVTSDETGAQRLEAHGFEAVCHRFGNEQEDTSFLGRLVSGRRLLAIVVAGLPAEPENPGGFLTVLRGAAIESRAPLLLCVPNAGEETRTLELLAGQAEREDGFLRTWGPAYTEKEIALLTQAAGWRETAKNDVIRRIGSVSEASSHTLLAPGSTAHKYVSLLKKMADPSASARFLVRAYLPGAVPSAPADGEKRPFLTVLTRTQGSRLSCLREVLLCLTAQTVTDFEVLVIGHCVSEQQEGEIQAVIKETPTWLREKIRFLHVDGGTRATPLNLGFSEARGSYISILDDDDLVFDNWVECFRRLYQKNPGKILRVGIARQDWEFVHTSCGSDTARAIGLPEAVYTKPFNFLGQLHQNECPTMGLAYPASVFQDLGVRFDEDMTTVEDWDFLMRSAYICGVADNLEIAGIYRWWANAESSKTVHGPEEWNRNQDDVLIKLDRMPLLLPNGYASQILQLVREHYNYLAGVPYKGPRADPSTLYVGYDPERQGFDPRQTMTMRNQNMGDAFEFNFDLRGLGPKTPEKVRWDPGEQAGLYIGSLKIETRRGDGDWEPTSLYSVTTNGLAMQDGFWFFHPDPQLTLPVPDGACYIRFSGHWSGSLPSETLSKMLSVYRDSRSTSLYYGGTDGFSESRRLFAMFGDLTDATTFHVLFDDMESLGHIAQVRWDALEQRAVHIKTCGITLHYADGHVKVLDLKACSSNGKPCGTGIWFNHGDPSLIFRVDGVLRSVTFDGTWAAFRGEPLILPPRPGLTHVLASKAKAVLRRLRIHRH